jgi:hypothetical protein
MEMAKKDKKKEVKGKKKGSIANFSCPYMGVIPYLRVLSSEEQQKRAEYIQGQIAAGNQAFNEMLNKDGTVNIPQVDQDYKPFPCCTMQKGEVLRCRFYQPIVDLVEDEEMEGEWECILVIQTRSTIMKNLSDIEKNDIEISMMELQIDELMAGRKELGLPKIKHPLDDDEDGDEDDEDDGEEPEETEEEGDEEQEGGEEGEDEEQED